MKKLSLLKPEKVFEFFEEISAVPHGSGNMEKISEWCLDFAKKRGLKCIRDDAYNVIIYKDGTKGREMHSPIILQGHLDMVCQKTPDCNIDMDTNPITLMVDEDFIKAKDTTLGADNAIAVAMILALLDSQDIPHPPIEAVFTTDEEVGMLGAMALDMSLLKAHRMINIDSEDFNTVTVACAGGLDFTAEIPLVRVKKSGRPIKILLDGLEGGHSGVEIGKNRTSAALLLGRVLNHLTFSFPFDLITLFGGDKSNVITKSAGAEIMTDREDAKDEILKYLEVVKREISSAEPGFTYSVSVGEHGNYNVIDKNLKERIITLLATSLQGVVSMSADIPGLVETSQNLGILTATDEIIKFGYSLRSSKTSALEYLSERMHAHFSPCAAKCTVSGAYPPWEFNKNSSLQKIYNNAFEEIFGKVPETVAIHAGLECGIFSSKIKNFDCISIGPELYDIHTPLERLNHRSVEKLWRVLLKTLEKLD